ncbi:hypothetical protein [Paraliobacillus sediminis]|uniref:hypothetical protein n=1 Tax=Paraliobacillus sediminis TaxID=1885916 RepID=UPI000E3C1BAA|nr:hypothetical protein [Paraliobacillus sediminis]
MVETAWDINEVKRLKKIQLVQGNLYMLLSFVLFVYLLMNGKAFVLIGLVCVLLWFFTTSIFYTLKTGKTIGTKTTRRVLEYDKYRLGKKRWKRRKIIEAVIISISSVGFTVTLFVPDFNYVRFDFINGLPFIGVWMGYNIGEIVRISDL